MKAALPTKYGLPGDLTVKEIGNSVPKDNEILIRVHASTVNRSDCHVLSGKSWFMQLFTGIFTPKESIIESDFTGQVEAVGSAVTAFKPGDRIMGRCFWVPSTCIIFSIGFGLFLASSITGQIKSFESSCIHSIWRS